MEAKPLVLAVSIALIVGVFGITLVLATSAGTPSVGDTSVSGDPSLETVKTASPECRNSFFEHSSVSSMPYRDGTRLKVTTTIPVPTQDTIVKTDFQEIGPRRYWLNFKRQAGQGTPDCTLGLQVNATIVVLESSRYSLLLTIDDQFVGSYWDSAETTGGFHQNPEGLAAIQPDAADPPPNKTTTATPSES